LARLTPKQKDTAAIIRVLVGSILCALCLLQLGLLVFVVARRVAYPFDLEWMEGGMLVHALRSMKGQPLYGPPSLEFVPYLYTPFYPAVVAALAKVVGLGYTVGRGVSLLALATLLGLSGKVARKEGAPLVVALVPPALIAAAYPFTGAWYDIVRNDTLALCLMLAGLYLIVYHHGRAWVVGLAGGLLGLAFLTKQTASAFLLAGAMGVLLLRWRTLPAYILGAGVVLGAVGGWLQTSSQGWFWVYIYRLHQNHDFYAQRAFVETPERLLRHEPVTLLGLVLLFALLLTARRLRRTGLFWTLVALAGVGISCVGFGTQWAFVNAFIPGVVFPAVALGALLGAACKAWCQAEASQNPAEVEGSAESANGRQTKADGSPVECRHASAHGDTENAEGRLAHAEASPAPADGDGSLAKAESRLADPAQRPASAKGSLAGAAANPAKADRSPTLAKSSLDCARRSRPAKLVVLALALAVGAQLGLRFYDPRPYLPTERSRQAGERLIERLRRVEGPVFIPDHPFYAVRAGKEPHFHRMGLWDVRRAGYGFPRGLEEAIRTQRFRLVVMDSRTQWHQWPGLRQYYRIVDVAHSEDMPHVYSGAGAATEGVRPLLFPQFFMEPMPKEEAPGGRPAQPLRYEDSP